MLLFFDTEFTGLHKNTTLISLGIVSEDNKKFYAEFIDYDKTQCDGWIMDNVIRYTVMDGAPKPDDCYCVVGTKEVIRNELLKWLERFGRERIQLVSDVCHYDMVLFIDIFGGAFDLPENISPVCYDINFDIANYYGITERESFNKNREDIVLDFIGSTIDGQKHNSLYDATIIKKLYYLL